LEFRNIKGLVISWQLQVRDLFASWVRVHQETVLSVVSFLADRARSNVIQKSRRIGFDVGDVEVVFEVRPSVVEFPGVWTCAIHHDDRVQRARGDATAITKSKRGLLCYSYTMLDFIAYVELKD